MTPRFCLSCSRAFEGGTRRCNLCDLPLIDQNATVWEYRHQVRSAQAVLARRAEVLIRATYPQRILRPEPAKEPKWWEQFFVPLAAVMGSARALWLVRESMWRKAEEQR